MARAQRAPHWRSAFGAIGRSAEGATRWLRAEQLEQL